MSTTRRRLGVFGGAFDPPHLAHRALAQVALAELRLDKLFVLPTGQAWHKTRALSAASYRLAMAQMAFAGIAGLVLDDREIRRAGPSYTLDTLREIQAEWAGAELFLVMGQDQANALPSWRHWQEIVRIAIICVADRDILTGLETAFVPPPEMASRFCRLHMPLMDISATGIRARIGSRQAIAPLVSPAVARYIDDHHLYQNNDDD